MEVKNISWNENVTNKSNHPLVNPTERNDATHKHYVDSQFEYLQG